MNKFIVVVLVLFISVPVVARLNCAHEGEACNGIECCKGLACVKPCADCDFVCQKTSDCDECKRNEDCDPCSHVTGDAHTECICNVNSQYKEYFCVKRQGCNICEFETPYDLDNDGYDNVNTPCQNVDVDCNDKDEKINPKQREICYDTIDQNCNGLVDKDDPECSMCGNFICDNGETKETCPLDCVGGAIFRKILPPGIYTFFSLNPFKIVTTPELSVMTEGEYMLGKETKPVIFVFGYIHNNVKTGLKFTDFEKLQKNCKTYRCLGTLQCLISVALDISNNSACDPFYEKVKNMESCSRHYDITGSRVYEDIDNLVNRFGGDDKPGGEIDSFYPLCCQENIVYKVSGRFEFDLPTFTTQFSQPPEVNWINATGWWMDKDEVVYSGLKCEYRYDYHVSEKGINITTYTVKLISSPNEWWLPHRLDDITFGYNVTGIIDPGVFVKDKFGISIPYIEPSKWNDYAVDKLPPIEIKNNEIKIGTDVMELDRKTIDDVASWINTIPGFYAIVLKNEYKEIDATNLLSMDKKLDKNGLYLYASGFRDDTETEKFWESNEDVVTIKKDDRVVVKIKKPQCGPTQIKFHDYVLRGDSIDIEWCNYCYSDEEKLYYESPQGDAGFIEGTPIPDTLGTPSPDHYYPPGCFRAKLPDDINLYGFIPGIRQFNEFLNWVLGTTGFSKDAMGVWLFRIHTKTGATEYESRMYPFRVLERCEISNMTINPSCTGKCKKNDFVNIEGRITGGCKRPEIWITAKSMDGTCKIEPRGSIIGINDSKPLIADIETHLSPILETVHPDEPQYNNTYTIGTRYRCPPDTQRYIVKARVELYDRDRFLIESQEIGGCPSKRCLYNRKEPEVSYFGPFDYNGKIDMSVISVVDKTKWGVRVEDVYCISPVYTPKTGTIQGSWKIKNIAEVCSNKRVFAESSMLIENNKPISSSSASGTFQFVDIIPPTILHNEKVMNDDNIIGLGNIRVEIRKGETIKIGAMVFDDPSGSGVLNVYLYYKTEDDDHFTRVGMQKANNIYVYRITEDIENWLEYYIEAVDKDGNIAQSGSENPYKIEIKEPIIPRAWFSVNGDTTETVVGVGDPISVRVAASYEKGIKQLGLFTKDLNKDGKRNKDDSEDWLVIECENKENCEYRTEVVEEQEGTYWYYAYVVLSECHEVGGECKNEFWIGSKNGIKVIVSGGRKLCSLESVKIDPLCKPCKESDSIAVTFNTAGVCDINNGEIMLYNESCKIRLTGPLYNNKITITLPEIPPACSGKTLRGVVAKIKKDEKIIDLTNSIDGEVNITDIGYPVIHHTSPKRIGLSKNEVEINTYVFDDKGVRDVRLFYWKEKTIPFDLTISIDSGYTLEDVTNEKIIEFCIKKKNGEKLCTNFGLDFSDEIIISNTVVGKIFNIDYNKTANTLRINGEINYDPDYTTLNITLTKAYKKLYGRDSGKITIVNNNIFGDKLFEIDEWKHNGVIYSEAVYPDINSVSANNVNITSKWIVNNKIMGTVEVSP